MCLGSQINSRLLWCARLAPAAMDDAALAKLEKLAEMKSKGILTEEEFAQQKAAVLGGSASNQVAAAPGGIQPIMMQPGMMGNQRPPPPGCPPGGQFVMVMYKGPVTEQAQQTHSATCCILGALFIMGPGILCCLFAGCPPQDLKDEKEVYQVGGTYYTLNGTVDTNVGPAGPPAPMPPVPIDVDPATAARLAELINRGVGVWKSSPTVSTNGLMTLTQTFELRPLSNGFYSTVQSTTGKNCLGCSDRRLTSERHGKTAVDGTIFTIQGIFGLIHGALTSYDTDSNVATYSFNGPGVSGTWVIDGHDEKITSHSKTVVGGRCYEFKFEFRR